MTDVIKTVSTYFLVSCSSFFVLCLSAVFTPKVVGADEVKPTFTNTAQSVLTQTANQTNQKVYFPRRGKLKRCLTTHIDTCIFNTSISVNTPIL